MNLIACCNNCNNSTVLDKEMTLQEFISANYRFSGTAYKEVLNDGRGNFLVSPLSAGTILALAQSGCEGETAQEIRSALHFPDGKDRVEIGIKSFLPTLKNTDQYVLRSANKMYVKENFPIKEGFKKVATEVYQSEMENINFIKNVEAAEIMNKWVEKQTNSKILNLIHSNDLDEYTKVVLINALYFKADWYFQFTGADTEKQDFYKTANDVIKVDMMKYSSRYQHQFNYHKSRKLKAKFLELQFNGEDASMIIVLPNKKEGLASLEKQIDAVFSTHKLKKQLVNITLPKFKIESTVDFKSVLKNLGVKKAFDDKEADLSGIAGEKGDLIINKIVQKTFIDVNEEGVEAAAATFVVIPVPLSGTLFGRDPPDFIADHPFLFYIKIKGAIAFVGRVLEPVQ